MSAWLPFALMALIMLGFVLTPLLRRGKAVATRADYDLEVYRQQLKELARDLERGLLSDVEAKAARTEIERRMLAVADEAAAKGGESAPRGRTIAAVVAAAVMPLAAFVVYMELGSPGLRDMPFAGREMPSPAPTQSAGAMPDVETMIARLVERVEANPDELEAWLRLGRAYGMTERPALAVEALSRAMELSGGRPDVAAEYGEALVLQHGGEVVPDARAAFRKVLESDPKDPRSRYYLAAASAQDGDWQAALDGWVALAQDSLPGAPWLPTLYERIEQAAGELNIDMASLPIEPAPAPGPDADAMAAAQDMSPAERREMIRNMVGGLAARLEQDPKNLEGWLMLARSYQVLGEGERAQQAIARVAEVYAGAPFVQSQIREAALDLGLEPPAVAGAPAAGATGPDQEQVAAAMAMPEEERRQMIAGMVEGLAARLDDSPQDLQGWLMLIRSYRVLGEEEKSEAAVAKALTVFADAPEQRAEVQGLARQLGLKTAPGAGD